MPGIHSRKLACTQAAGLRKNMFPDPQTRMVKIILGLRGQTGAGFIGSISPPLSLASVQFQ